jgi:nitrogen regulatory protein P-II 2
MKQLEALIMTFNLDRVKEGLARLGVGGMTVSEVQRARSADRPDSSVATSSTPDFLPRVEVRVVVPDHLSDQTAEILRNAT